MTKDELEAVLSRVRTWPPDLQEEAVYALTALEKDVADVFELGEEELADIREGLAEAERGEFLTDEEVQHLFRRRR